jgi:hypothetical protein
VTHLRQLMLEELRRRNYSESTVRAYLRTVEHFAGYFHRPPDRLGLDHIRQYQAAMFTQWRLAPNTSIYSRSHPSNAGTKHLMTQDTRTESDDHRSIGAPKVPHCYMAEEQRSRPGVFRWGKNLIIRKPCYGLMTILRCVSPTALHFSLRRITVTLSCGRVIVSDSFGVTFKLETCGTTRSGSTSSLNT